MPCELLENFKSVEGHLDVRIVDLLAENIYNAAARLVLKECIIILEADL